MARTYLFLVHGVGKHPAETWSDSWKRVLIDKLRTYAPYKERSPEAIERDTIRFIDVGYDSVFEGFRKDWEDLEEVLASTAFALGPDLRAALEWVASQDADVRAIFLEKVLDALLWATNPQARAAVIAHVNDQLGRHLVEMNLENEGANTAHLLAHSLGTSVISDALIGLRSERWVHEGAWDSTRFRWRSLTMLANTSRLLEPRFDVSDALDREDFRVYGSGLFPGTEGSIVQRYTTVRHRVDPITWPNAFQPGDSWRSPAYSEVETVHFDDVANVHDFGTYASNPSVHLPLFRTILGNQHLGSSSELAQARQSRARDFPRVAGVEFQHLRDLIGGNPTQPISLRRLVEFLVNAFKELKR